MHRPMLQRFTARIASLLLVAGAAALSACALGSAEAPDDPNTTDEPGDAATPEPEPESPPPDGKVMPGAFNKDVVMWDKHFTAPMAADNIQRFLDVSPYGNRTWLATEVIDGKPLAEVLEAIGAEFQINPLILMARMQAEKSAIAATARPAASDIDYLLGCGCPDQRSCAPQYKGLANQLRCAARTLRTHFDASVAGTGAWRKGLAKRTSDNIAVTPGNHSTAALYAYTPWVNNGGNRLVFTVTLKFTQHAQLQAQH